MGGNRGCAFTSTSGSLQVGLGNKVSKKRAPRIDGAKAREEGGLTERTVSLRAADEWSDINPAYAIAVASTANYICRTAFSNRYKAVSVGIKQVCGQQDAFRLNEEKWALRCFTSLKGQSNCDESRCCLTTYLYLFECCYHPFWVFPFFQADVQSVQLYEIDLSCKRVYNGEFECE